jgi:ribosomal protein L21E
MNLLGRRIGAVVAAGFVAAAVPAPAAIPLDHAIGIVVNGQELARDPAPRVVGKGGGRIAVPLVKIMDALGIAVTRDGDDITADAFGKRIAVHIGSTHATIGTSQVTLAVPATEIDGSTYVPLRFVADAFGAQATFNARANRVEITSSLVGRNPGLEQRSDGGSAQIVGTVGAVDLNSSPQSISVVRGGAARTVPVTGEARILVQDVIARTSAPGSLYDVHVGDAISIIVRPDGHAGSVVARYASRTGTIAAVSGTAFVLDNGFVVTPDKVTQITLNAQPATIGDLKVGDSVVVRLNPDTNEKRQILVSRAAPAAPVASPGATQITAFGITAKGPLHAGDAFDVGMRGTPGGRATFDIGSYVTAVPMTEREPGVYSARYTVPQGVNFGRTSVYGHLTVAGVDPPRAEAPSLIVVTTTPPQIVDVAPANGQTVNNNRPSIFATYQSPMDVAIVPGTVTINVNGLDVTASSTRTPAFITYSPGVALNDGPVDVTVRVTDEAGNTQTRKWTFTIRSH